MENFTNQNSPKMDAVFPGLFMTVKIKVVGFRERSQGGAKSITASFNHVFITLTKIFFANNFGSTFRHPL